MIMGGDNPATATRRDHRPLAAGAGLALAAADVGAAHPDERGPAADRQGAGPRRLRRRTTPRARRASARTSSIPTPRRGRRPARMARPRMYHSVALLLPDATVLGGRLQPPAGHVGQTRWRSTARPTCSRAGGGAGRAADDQRARRRAVGYNADLPGDDAERRRHRLGGAGARRARARTRSTSSSALVNLAFTAGSGTRSR